MSKDKQQGEVEGVQAPPSHAMDTPKPPAPKGHAEGAEAEPPPAKSVKFYYSSGQNMYVNVNPGKRVLEEGNVARIGEKGAQFLPNGSGFGVLQTSDPEVIAWMDRHIADGNTDIFGQQEYNKRLLTPTQRAEDLERKLTEANTLIAKLQAEGKLNKAE